VIIIIELSQKAQGPNNVTERKKEWKPKLENYQVTATQQGVKVKQYYFLFYLVQKKKSTNFILSSSHLIVICLFRLSRLLLFVEKVCSISIVNIHT